MSKFLLKIPEYTTNVNAIGTLRILEAIRRMSHIKKIKFYQAGTSEMFGASKPPQNEKNNFSCSKPICSCKIVCSLGYKNYRDSITCLQVMEFYLIMKAYKEVKHLSQKKNNYFFL